jgi:mono/diheme cytochrome c family protein
VASSWRPLRGLRFTLAMLALPLLAACALLWPPPLGLDTAAPTTQFDPALVRAGERLAAVGNCVSCHTAADGADYAGGRPLRTQFGTIYATNITPEPETGIGLWSEAAFQRALREGVSRDGHLLYPAFPYDHFTHMEDADIRALYAYMMTRVPVRAVPPPNKLVFPLQFRPLIAGWNLLFLEKGPRPAQPGRSAEWNRGAYLVDAVAHCSACHTPRNRLGAEVRRELFDGGDIEGWRASALNARSESPVPWTAESLAAYLRSGLVPEHAMSAGPMQDVVSSLSEAEPADVHAMATFFASTMGPPTPERMTREAAARQRAQQRPVDVQDGARLYADNCAACHDAGRGLSSSDALQLPLAIGLYLPDARNLLRIVREGIQPVADGPGPWMPPFEGTLSEDQLATLASWLRQQAAGEAPWPDLARALKDTRPTPP